MTVRHVWIVFKIWYIEDFKEDISLLLFISLAVIAIADSQCAVRDQRVRAPIPHLAVAPPSPVSSSQPQLLKFAFHYWLFLISFCVCFLFFAIEGSTTQPEAGDVDCSGMQQRLLPFKTRGRRDLHMQFSHCSRDHQVETTRAIPAESYTCNARRSFTVASRLSCSRKEELLPRVIQRHY